ncbi:hypothetical protein LINPERHAP2_LOCUS32722 [Linum perenne]
MVGRWSFSIFIAKVTVQRISSLIWVIATFGTHLIPISDCNLGFYLRLDTMDISDSRSILVTT